MLQACHSCFQVNCGMVLCLLTRTIKWIQWISNWRFKWIIAVLFVDTFGLDYVSSMALELKELINDTIDELKDWLAIVIGQYSTNGAKGKCILHWQIFFGVCEISGNFWDLSTVVVWCVFLS